MFETDENVVNFAYASVSDFLSILSKRDFGTLGLKYDISSAVAEEIEELLDEYFEGESLDLTPPPLEVAFLDKSPDRPLRIFKGNRGWVVDSVLWNNGRRGRQLLTLTCLKKGENLSWNICIWGLNLMENR